MLSTEQGRAVAAAVVGFIAEQSKTTVWLGWTPGSSIDTGTAEGSRLEQTVAQLAQMLAGTVDSVSFIHATHGEHHICRVPAHPYLFVVTTADGSFSAGQTNMLYAVVESSLNALARGQIRPDEVRELPYRPNGIRGIIDERSDWYAIGQNRYAVVVYDWRQSTIASRLHLYERTAGVYLEVAVTDEERDQLAKLIELKRLSARAAGA